MKHLTVCLLLCAAFGTGCDGDDWPPCNCPSAEESGAGEVYNGGTYSFSHADATNALRAGELAIDDKQVRITYRGPDGRMYRATFAKGARTIGY